MEGLFYEKKTVPTGTAVILSLLPQLLIFFSPAEIAEMAEII
jgi:hypothetical protein